MVNIHKQQAMLLIASMLLMSTLTAAGAALFREVVIQKKISANTFEYLEQKKNSKEAIVVAERELDIEEQANTSQDSKAYILFEHELSGRNFVEVPNRKAWMVDKVKRAATITKEETSADNTQGQDTNLSSESSVLALYKKENIHHRIDVKTLKKQGKVRGFGKTEQGVALGRTSRKLSFSGGLFAETIEVLPKTLGTAKTATYRLQFTSLACKDDGVSSTSCADKVSAISDRVITKTRTCPGDTVIAQLPVDYYKKLVCGCPDKSVPTNDGICKTCSPGMTLNSTTGKCELTCKIVNKVSGQFIRNINVDEDQIGKCLPVFQGICETMTEMVTDDDPFPPYPIDVGWRCDGFGSNRVGEENWVMECKLPNTKCTCNSGYRFDKYNSGQCKKYAKCYRDTGPNGIIQELRWESEFGKCRGGGSCSAVYESGKKTGWKCKEPATVGFNDVTCKRDGVGCSGNVTCRATNISVFTGEVTVGTEMYVPIDDVGTCDVIDQEFGGSKSLCANYSDSQGSKKGWWCWSFLKSPRRLFLCEREGATCKGGLGDIPALLDTDIKK